MDSDPNRLREVEIQRLTELAALAYKNALDEKLKIKTREGWYQKYTNAVLALNQLLKDSQLKDYEKRLKVIEESGRILRRTILTRPEAGRLNGPAGRKTGNTHRSVSRGRRVT